MEHKFTHEVDESDEIASLRKTISALKEEVDRLRSEILIYPLTGLRNRTGLRCAWEASLTTSVMLIDVDRFKSVNDRYGHATGDMLLCHLADAIRLCGLVGARIGGDEFVAMTTEQQDPAKTAERLRELVSVPVAIRGDQITMTVTIGICHVTHAGMPMSPYLKIADDALYLGKRAGRNIVVVATTEPIRNEN